MSAPPAPTLLIVEPLVSVRASLERLLEKRGVSVLLSGTGREALRRLERQPVGAALLSLRLPDMDGLALCRRVSTAREGVPGRCRVLMLAPLDDLPLDEAEGVSERARAAGALGLLPLPVQAEQLFTLVERVLGLPLRPLNPPAGARWPHLLRALRVGQAGVLGLTLLGGGGELLVQSGELLAPQLLAALWQQMEALLALSPQLGPLAGPLRSLQLEYEGRALLLLSLSVRLEGARLEGASSERPADQVVQHQVAAQQAAAQQADPAGGEPPAGEPDPCLLVCLLQDAGQASLVRYRLQHRGLLPEQDRPGPPDAPS